MSTRTIGPTVQRETMVHDDRRRHQRVDVQLPVTIRFRGRLIPATAMNLSCGGVQLDTGKAILQGTEKVELVLDLSELERDIPIQGEIAWCEVLDRKSCVGIRFTNLFTLGHEAIDRYMRRKDKQ